MNNVLVKHANRLAREKSPYLLQHAHNPVDWYPWGDEAFEAAAREDKPVFLSIGYSTCHWCHVMAHESFEDEQVAGLMNDAFVCVKVDREERPDIDAFYMTVCQMLTGGGGWPLTVFMTPDKQPFYAGTYYPKESRFGRIGMVDLIPRIKEIWRSKKKDVVGSAREILDTLRNMNAGWRGDPLGESSLETAYREMSERFDAERGGFGLAPKFPTPHNYFFLLRYWMRKRDPRSLQMVEKSLDAMRLGGIYDQIGFGFHRYSVDRDWRVPHFEKMLYDQALLSLAYTEAYQATKKKEHREAAERILAYVLRDLRDESGAFYASEDADSEGEEGKFYLWTCGEARQALSGEDAGFALSVFNMEEEGNFVDEARGEKTGKNVLYLSAHPDQDSGVRLERVRAALLAAREKRVRPHRDEKILADWNGLMIAALARGSRAFDRPEYAESARKAADFLLEKMGGRAGRLQHRYQDGEAAIGGYLNDYAFLVWGLLELYEATFEADYLERAIALNREMLFHFWDDQEGGLFLTPDDGEPVLVRMKEIYDGAIPSGNAVALSNLTRLARITGDVSLDQKGAEMLRAFSRQINQSPAAFTQFMTALSDALGPFCEVVIAGDASRPETKEMIEAVRRPFIPNKIVLFRDDAKPDAIGRLAPFSRELKSDGGKPRAYVCDGEGCRPPVATADALTALLREVAG